jgi:uncharacterized protein YndB with AHSA1/START domain
MTLTTDRIEKQILIDAPRSRVWRALTDSREFGEWFKIRFEEPFAAGKTLTGRMTHPRYENFPVEFAIDRIEPEHAFSYRWHPYAIDPNHDYSQEPMTLVEFRLEEQGNGTLLRVVETGFDGIPLARRAEALKMNEGGWTHQIQNIQRFVQAGA